MSLIAKSRVALNARHRIDHSRAEFAYWFRRPGRVLFDHIAKCGGTTVTRFLARNFPPRMTFVTQKDYIRSAQEFGTRSEKVRLGYRLITGHQSNRLIEHVHPDTVITTVLREPVDRIVSWYYFIQQEMRRGNRPTDPNFPATLAEFATGEHDPQISNQLTRHFTGLTADEIAEDPDAAIDRAVAAVKRTYHVVGFQDDLAGFADQVMRAARLWRPLEGLTLNRTEKRPSLLEVSDSVREHIAACHAIDIKLYARLRAR